jgi:adenylate kinase
MNIVLLGPPGVGKGTYGEILSKKYSIPKISTGDIFRAAVKSGSELGNKVKSILDKGMLVPDEITIEVVKQRLHEPDCKKGFMLDGFPRTIPQAEALDKITKIHVALNFKAKDQTIIDRIAGRRTCKKCGAIYHLKNMPPQKTGVCDKCGGELYMRDDQKPEVVKDRLKVYKEQTEPLVKYYHSKKVLAEVDAQKDINDPEFHVIDDCVKILDKL